MKLQVLQEELSKALSLANRFASAKAQLPVLGNILLSSKKSKLLISSTNLEISINIAIGAKVETEGDITIPAKIITDIVTNLNPEQINLVSKEENLNITNSEFESTISGMNALDFPSIPKKMEKVDLSIPKDELAKALSLVLFAVSSDETRPILTGVLFICKKGELTLVATDGYRLSQVVLKKNSITKSFKIILPKAVLGELTRLPSDGDIEFYFDEPNNQAVFKSENIILSSRVLEGAFPDYQKIIPKDFMLKILAEKDDLIQAVKLASVFARDSANIVKLSIKKGKLEFSTESQLSGRQKTKIEAKIDGEDLDIAFNYRFLEEILQAIEEEDVSIEFSGSSSPAVFKDLKNSNFLHLIMPVKLQD
ncbi:MAG TPA: DNA polymerase III subunit beta [Patescibacteria group bacterium]|nr:DNA polymerase III subunit beta [Patescibacteria group bacterium]